MAKQKKEMSMKAKIAVLFLCPLIVIALTSGAVVLTANSVVDSEKYTATEETPEVKLPQGDEIAETLQNAIKTANSCGDAKVTGSVDVQFSELDGNMTDAQKNLLLYFGDSIASSVKDMYEIKSADYGEDCSAFAIPVFDALEQEASANEAGTELSIRAVVLPDDEAFIEYINGRDGKITALVEEKSTDECRITLTSSELADIQIESKINADDGRLKNFKVERNYKISCTLEFAGALAGLGTQECTFNCYISENYSYSYVELKIDQDNISIEHNGYETLDVSANVSENASSEECKVVFTSSDESVATVDENGMVEGVCASEAPVTVTATLTYLGRTYTDSVTVYVGTPVESVSVSPSKHTLNVGETYTFTAKVSPSDATNQNVTWISEDEAVATVDENTGLVTAVAVGDTRIIAVTVDGNYMSASEITVEGGADK